MAAIRAKSNSNGLAVSRAKLLLALAASATVVFCALSLGCSSPAPSEFAAAESQPPLPLHDRIEDKALAEAEKQIAQGAEQVKDSALTLNILSGELYKLLNEFKID